MNDLCSIFITFGKDIVGGHTRYYESQHSKIIVYEEKFEHLKYQIGSFDRVYHEGLQWKGKRGVISFYVNRKIVNHFLNYGIQFYEKYLSNMEENEDFQYNGGYCGSKRDKKRKIHKQKHKN